MKKADALPEVGFAIIYYPVLLGHVIFAIFDAIFFDDFQRKLLMDDLRKLFNPKIWKINLRRR